MVRRFAFAGSLALWAASTLAAIVGSGPPDPYILQELVLPGVGWNSNRSYCDAGGKTLRASQAVDVSKKNLILIIAGQSNVAAEAPSAYVPTNATAVHNLSICDGGIYAWADAPLGSTWSGPGAPFGPGHIGGDVADRLINAGAFDQVFGVPIAVGASVVADWDTGVLAQRPCIAMKRLAAKGIVPGANVTFGVIWGQGESEAGTTTNAYQTGLTNVGTRLVGCGMTGRIFVNKQTWGAGAVLANVQAAQLAIVDNVTYFAGANADSLNATNRLADNTHFNDTGRSAFSALEYTALHASGAPY